MQKHREFFYVCYTFLERKKQTHKAITKALSAGIASFVYGHFQPLSTQRKIVLVTKTVVAKIQPPTREYVAVCKVRARYKRNAPKAKEIPP